MTGGYEVWELSLIMMTIKDVFDVYAQNGVTIEMIKMFMHKI